MGHPRLRHRHGGGSPYPPLRPAHQAGRNPFAGRILRHPDYRRHLAAGNGLLRHPQSARAGQPRRQNHRKRHAGHLPDRKQEENRNKLKIRETIRKIFLTNINYLSFLKLIFFNRFFNFFWSHSYTYVSISMKQF